MPRTRPTTAPPPAPVPPAAASPDALALAALRAVVIAIAAGENEDPRSYLAELLQDAFSSCTELVAEKLLAMEVK
jgi:hypothetical protein